MDLMRRDDRLCQILLFALTPPRLATAAGRVQEIADATIARLRGLDLDGLILYDIDDEAERNPAQRPFPFTPTLDPADSLADYLADWPTPVLVGAGSSTTSPRRLPISSNPTFWGWPKPLFCADRRSPRGSTVNVTRQPEALKGGSP